MAEIPLYSLARDTNRCIYINYIQVVEIFYFTLFLLASVTGARAITGLTSDFELATGPIHLFNVECTGEEEALANCTYPPPTVQHTCTHFDDAGVDCEGEGPLVIDTAVLMRYGHSVN